MCAPTRDLFAIAKFLVSIRPGLVGSGHRVNCYVVGLGLGSVFFDPVQALPRTLCAL